MAGKQVSLRAAVAAVAAVMLVSGCGMVLLDGRAKRAERDAENTKIACALEQLRHTHITAPSPSAQAQP